MILAGYSPISGSGTSSGMAALVCMDHLLYERDTLLITVGDKEGSGEVLLSETAAVQEEYRFTTGLNGLLRFWKAGQMNLHSIQQCATTMPYCRSNMDILTGRITAESHLFYEDLCSCLPELLAAAQTHYQRIYLDLPSDAQSCRLFPLADMVFVFLTQDRRTQAALDRVSFQRHNVYYLLSRYDKGSFNTLFNYKRWFPWLRKQLVGVIPYETAYLDAWASGRIAEFFLSRFKNSKKDPGGRIVSEVKKLLVWIEKEEKNEKIPSDSGIAEDRRPGLGSKKEL